MNTKLTICFPFEDAALADEALWQPTLRSLLSQSTRDFNVVLGAADKSALTRIATELAAHAVETTTVVAAEKTNWSIYNACLLRVQAPYVKFVLPGDVLEDDCIAKFVDAFEQDDDISIITSPLRHLSADRTRTTVTSYGTLIGKSPRQDVLCDIVTYLHNPIGALSNVAFKRQAAIGGFDERFVLHGELDLWLTLLRHGDLLGFSHPLVAAPENERAARKNLLRESMLEISDLLLFKEKLAEYAAFVGMPEYNWHNSVETVIDQRLKTLRYDNMVDAELVAHAARTLAQQSTRDNLERFVELYAKIAYDRSFNAVRGDIVAGPNDARDSMLLELQRDVKLLRKELRRVGTSLSWRVTEPLRLLNARLKPGAGEVKLPVVRRADAEGDQIPLKTMLMREIDELRRTLRKIKASSSWKITGPLRVLSDPLTARSDRAFQQYVTRVQPFEQPPIKASIAVFDDMFPLKLSAFRYQEYTGYLDAFPDAYVFTTGESIPFIKQGATLDATLKLFKNERPDLAPRVVPYNYKLRVDADLAYCVFVSLADKFLPYFEQQQLPFVFTLYPGGKFELGERASDEMVKRVTSSPNCVGMITTQRMVTDYVKKRKLCDETKMIEIIGGVMPEIYESIEWSKKRLYGVHKNNLDICFVAFKYTKQGEEKGYPAFIQAAKLIAKRHPHVHFHVIGGFGKNDVDVTEIRDRITFHGPLNTERLATLYQSMDMIISPTKHGTRRGHFDGFPTGATIEAAMSGVAVVASDTLNQNVFFSDGVEMLFVEPVAGAIVDKVEPYLADHNKLYALAQRGQSRYREVFGCAAQMKPRIELLRSVIANARNSTRELAGTARR